MSIDAILTAEQIQEIDQVSERSDDNSCNAIQSLLAYQEALWELLDEFEIQWSVWGGTKMYCGQCGGWRDAIEDVANYKHKDWCPHTLLAEIKKKAGRG